VGRLVCSGIALGGLLVAAGNLQPAAAAVVFWSGLGLAGFTLAGYGLVIRLLAAMCPRPVRKRSIEPVVSIVVVAYNEGERIAAKIENLLAMDYPRNRVEIVVASDGSADDTVACARAYEPRIRVAAFDARRGKPAVLNDVVPTLRGAVVVLADARQRFDPLALTALTRPFADPTVGAVSGELILVETAEHAVAGRGAALYWDREKRIRFDESCLDSAIGATGAIYALRRDLFEPIPADTILDDVLIPMRIARQGYRVIFEPAAKAFDQGAATARQELVRKVRTIAGNFQLFTRERWLLDPWRNRLWVQTVSHKALRLALPLMFLATLAANVRLLDAPLYRWTLAGQLGSLALAAGLWCVPAMKRRLPVLVAPYTVCFLCAATVIGFVRFLTGQQTVTWVRSAEPGESATLRSRPPADHLSGPIQHRP
jgi:cellulose synthase/poly-beta-1,6-N-acetylglucosamine synthase-like glycosyltransferase